MPRLSKRVKDRIKTTVTNAGYSTLRDYLQVEYLDRKRTGCEVCRMMGVANRTLYVILDIEGFPRPQDKSGNTKYEDLDKDAIIEMLKAGSLMRECAEAHNCSMFYIHRVKREYKQSPPEVIKPTKKTPEEILQEQYPAAYAFAHGGVDGVRALKEGINAHI